MDLGVMAMKGYSILPRPLELEPHHKMQFRVIPKGSLLLWREYSPYILSFASRAVRKNFCYKILIFYIVTTIGYVFLQEVNKILLLELKKTLHQQWQPISSSGKCCLRSPSYTVPIYINELRYFSFHGWRAVLNIAYNFLCCHDCWNMLHCRMLKKYWQTKMRWKDDEFPPGKETSQSCGHRKNTTHFIIDVATSL